MTARQRHILAGLVLAVVVGLSGLRRPSVVTAADTLPERIPDAEFRQLIADMSESNGTFRSNNLLSNEISFQHALPRLVQMTRPGRVYLGVGPEQNFTYVAALRPAVAFIVDLRQGNVDLHLMYKALFEISADRAEFVSRLFSRPRPAGLDARSSVGEIFGALANVRPTESFYTQNLSDMRNQLLNRHGLALSDAELSGIEFVYRAFFTLGPTIRYSPIGLAGGTTQPTYAELMAATDEGGNARGFLSSEAVFGFVKGLQSRNLVVPIVGNFAGPKAIRAVGRYAKDRGATVSAFYLSNVEEYLVQDGVWRDFCANVATLPLDDASTLIRSVRIDGPAGPRTGFVPQLKGMVEAVSSCDRSGP
ncbi:MAG: hypothetical protein A3G76_00760 [Acidobacteria bacterium RIFCSPLOWO2_12_FULL_65_11]|nr:MAG: hypothetical protein A3H95_07650 [Acidobacteria bacterium RIFCSPLOWO2_02_FULL_64_15]OFW34624.1 MAG: hypothetical protein A3G76_00760 [Acidobacteria bacterium RIFCSPLOWO2_12_FULL_65_11]